MNRIAAALLASIALAAFPAMAAAKGGAATSTANAGTSTPTLSSSPCASITVPKAVDSLNVFGKKSAIMRMGATVTSCSSLTQNLSIIVTDSAYDNTTGADCSIPAFSLAPMTMKAGSSRTISFDSPEPPAMICTHMFTETLVSDAGTVLDAATVQFNTVSRG